MRRIISLAIIIAVLACTALSQSGSERRAASDVLDKGGTLHEAAIAAGGVYVTTRGNNAGWVAPSRLSDLAKHSKVVVQGTAIDNVGKLTKDERSIVSLYTFRVEESFKGRYRPGNTILVVLPGGRFSFPDGTLAQINTPDFPKMRNGQRYLLFLSEKKEGVPNQSKEYYPTTAQHGVFGFEQDGTILPFAREGLDPLSGLRGMRQDVFLLRLQKAVADGTASETPSQTSPTVQK